MAELLALEGVSAGYGEAIVLEDVGFALPEGGSLALLGRNGAGKTTLLLAIMGLARLHRGTIRWRHGDLATVPAFRRARAGLGWVPQERAMFASLSVDEHLRAVARPGHWTPERVYALFPALAERKRNLGQQLSGGEQQMLAIGRALAVNPALLLLDEPMEGLAPVIVRDLVDALARIGRDTGLALLVVEQHARLALALTREAIVLERGRVAHRAASAALLAEPAALHRYVALA